MPSVWPPDLEMSAEIGQMFDQDDADQVVMVGRSKKSGSINSVEFIPNWTQVGAANPRTYTLFNRRSDGTGTTTVAQLVMTVGASMTKFVPKSITLSTAALTLNVGDVLEWESLHGVGMPDPGGKVVVQFAQT